MPIKKTIAILKNSSLGAPIKLGLHIFALSHYCHLCVSKFSFRVSEYLYMSKIQ